MIGTTLIEDYHLSNEPIHIHVQKGDSECKYWLDIATSGYGIHWYAIDEDLTTKGLIKLAEIAKTA